MGLWNKSGRHFCVQLVTKISQGDCVSRLFPLPLKGISRRCGFRRRVGLLHVGQAAVWARKRRPSESSGASDLTGYVSNTSGAKWSMQANKENHWGTHTFASLRALHEENRLGKSVARSRWINYRKFYSQQNRFMIHNQNKSCSLYSYPLTDVLHCSSNNYDWIWY